MAKNIANHQHYCFVEADDFHSREAIEMMSNGIPLTDDIRAEWVERLKTFLETKAAQKIDCTLAFSGLKLCHRQILQQTPFKHLSILIHGDKDQIKERMNKRSDHFMPASLLDSQFEALEFPETCNELLVIDIDQRPHQQLEQALAFINKHITKAEAIPHE